MKVTDLKSNLLELARCQTCSVRESALFAGMNDGELSRWITKIDDVKYFAADVIFRQGDEGRFIYTLREGMIKLNRIRQNGEQRIMRILRPGDVVGLEAIVSKRYEYDAVALDEVAVCRIPVGMIQQMDVESPVLHLKLLERWHRTVTEADEWMSELTSGSARARLARLLLKMRNPQKPGLSTLFSRDDIGSMLCMTMETASRTINAFQREGKISSLDATGRFYKIDVDALEHVIQEAD